MRNTFCYRSIQPIHYLVLLVFYSFVCSINAAEYDLESFHSNSLRKLKLNVPDSIDNQVIRAIFIVGNGAGGDQTAQANLSEYIAFAEHYGLAILATGYWGNFSDTNDAEIELFESMIVQLAEASGHPELANAPWLPTGHSNGGQMSYGFNAKRPERTIAFITGSGGFYNDLRPSVKSLMTPGMIICGAEDRSYRVTANRNLFENNRPRGALWAWTEQEGSEHEEGEMRHLKLAFLEECLRLRYPPDQNPLHASVPLKTLGEQSGWLVNQNSRNSGDGHLVEIAPYDQFAGISYDWGWVPTSKIAGIYQAYSTFGKIADHQNISSSASPVLRGQNYSYAPTMSRDDWTKIEYFLDGIKVDEVSSDRAYTAFTVSVDTGGFHTVYGIVTLNSGEIRSMAIRTFFQMGENRLSEFEQWIHEATPTEITIVDSSIDRNQFVDSDGNFTLLQRSQILNVSAAHLDQEETGNVSYHFEVLCHYEDEGSDFLYRLAYQFLHPANPMVVIGSQSLQSISIPPLRWQSSPLLELAIPQTFEGLE